MMNFKIITQSERSQKKEEQIRYDFIYRKRKLSVSWSKPLCLGMERKDRWFQRCMRKLWGVMDMFIILIQVMVSQLYTYVPTYPIIHFKYMQFPVLETCLHINGRKQIALIADPSKKWWWLCKGNSFRWRQVLDWTYILKLKLTGVLGG